MFDWRGLPIDQGSFRPGAYRLPGFPFQDALYVNMREQIDKKAIQKRSEQLGGQAS